MKILNFTYTKTDGSTSNRTLMPITSPSDGYFGVDITELDDETLVSFVLAYERLYKEFDAKTKELLAANDLTHNYRYFLENNMSGIEHDEV